MPCADRASGERGIRFACVIHGHVARGPEAPDVKYQGGCFMRYSVTVALVLLLVSPFSASAQLVGNPACPGEDVFYDPGHGEDIIVPNGYKVEVFARDLNMPTDIAFAHGRAYVLESGTGLPGRCNNNELPAFGGKFSASNPFTPDLLIFNMAGHLLAGPLGKPTATGGG